MHYLVFIVFIVATALVFVTLYSVLIGLKKEIIERVKLEGENVNRKYALLEEQKQFMSQTEKQKIYDQWFGGLF
jgi:Trk-type K+ transport system membrane component